MNTTKITIGVDRADDGRSVMALRMGSVCIFFTETMPTEELMRMLTNAALELGITSGLAREKELERAARPQLPVPDETMRQIPAPRRRKVWSDLEARFVDRPTEGDTKDGN